MKGYIFLSRAFWWHPAPLSVLDPFPIHVQVEPVKPTGSDGFTSHPRHDQRSCTLTSTPRSRFLAEILLLATTRTQVPAGNKSKP